jgi:subtilisin
MIGGRVGDRETQSCSTERSDSSRIGRRACLKLVGVAAASATGVAVGSDPVRAASDGYGEAGYGEGPYGGDGGFTVSTGEATSVDATSATLGGELSDLDGADSADCYFEWRRTGASSWTATTEQTLSSTGSYSERLSGLEDGVEYEYRAVGSASDGDSATGDTVTFATTDDAPAVATDDPSDVTDSTATLNGSLNDLGGADSADCAFEWRSVGASSWNTTATRTLSSTGSYSADVSGLSSGTDYEYRAVVTASDGDTDAGGTTSFTTDGGSTAPSVDSYSVTEAGSPNPHAEITADWSVSDADGDLDRVEVEVSDASGTVVDAATTGVSGGSAAGTDEFKIRHANGQTFDVTATVTDAAGNSDSRTRSITE